jgi:putative membrane protein
MKFYVFIFMRSALFIITLFTFPFLEACNGQTMKTEKIILEEYDAQLMDIEEGKLAKERGTTLEIQEYGRRMIKEHEAMLMDTRELAEKKDIILPTMLTKEKMEGLMELKEKNGEDFDKKFIKMMIIDHERDVRCLKHASKSDDPDVKSYGIKYLPILEAELKDLKEIKNK